MVSTMLTKKVWSDLVSRCTTFLFDADGVLWLGDEPVDGATTVVQQLADMGKRVIMVTNNSTKSVMTYEKKCARLGFPAFTQENIVGPTVVLVDYLQKQRLSKPKVFLIGAQGIKDELTTSNIEFLGFGPDHFGDYSDTEFLTEVPIDKGVGAVVVGYDNHFSYVKMMKAATYLKDHDCLFIATNVDEVFPTNRLDMVVPGTGCMVNAVKTAAKREPVIMGKPQKTLADYIFAKWHINPSETVMIGDNCKTDIQFGNTNGMTTIATLSGVTKLVDLERYKEQSKDEWIPNFFVNSLKDLV